MGQEVGLRPGLGRRGRATFNLNLSLHVVPSLNFCLNPSRSPHPNRARPERGPLPALTWSLVVEARTSTRVTRGSPVRRVTVHPPPHYLEA